MCERRIQKKKLEKTKNKRREANYFVYLSRLLLAKPPAYLLAVTLESWSEVGDGRRGKKEGIRRRERGARASTREQEEGDLGKSAGFKLQMHQLG